MLVLYRRHLASCAHRNDGRAYRRCRCPIWVDGLLNGVEVRQSLRVRDWQRAQDMMRALEAGAPTESAPITIEQACDSFLADAVARGLRESSLYKYRLLFGRLQTFAEQRGVRFLSELDLESLRVFRNGWPDHNMSALKKLERLRAFLNFAADAGWIGDNPARKLKNPKISQSPTLPLSREEISRILAACDIYPDRVNALRLRALVLLLRYSGLRIRDAVTLSCDRIHDGKLFLSTQKTGVVVWCPLPAPVIAALLRIPIASGESHFFWGGASKPKSIVGDWQRSLRRLFHLAGTPDAHAHRFRDTFAVELLLAGVPLERVSILLGHQSLKVTERHYAPWVRARQEQLEADVRRTWDADLAALAETKGTPEVHGRTALPN